MSSAVLGSLQKEDTGLNRSTHTLHQEQVGQGIRRSCSAQMRGSDSVYPKDSQVLASICLPILKFQHSSQIPKALVSTIVLCSFIPQYLAPAVASAWITLPQTFFTSSFLQNSVNSSQGCHLYYTILCVDYFLFS